MTSSDPDYGLMRGFRRLIPHAPVLPDEERNREARLAYLVAWVLFVFSLGYGLARLFVLGDPGMTPALFYPRHVILPLTMAAISLLCMAVLHRGSVRFASGLLVGATWVALVLLSGGLGGVRGVSYAGLLVVVVLAGLLLGGRASALVVVMSLVAGWALADAGDSETVLIDPISPLEVLVAYAALLSMAAGLIAGANSGYRRLLGRMYGTERDMRAQNWELRQMRESLERRVAQRTEDLDRRSGYLEAAARVAYAAGEILDVEDLLRESVDLIRDAFGLYYVGLFLVAPGTEGADAAGAPGNGDAADLTVADQEAVDRPWAVLRAGTGEAGRRMLARGHRIRVGEGMVGWSIEQGQSRFAQRAVEDDIRLRAPELPETRAEAALPLRARGRVVGALTVQSVQVDFFDVDTVTVLQTMADLTAVALSNAELFEEAGMAMEALRRAYGEISVAAWGALLQRRRNWGYRYADGRVQPIQDVVSISSEGPTPSQGPGLDLGMLGAVPGDGPWVGGDRAEVVVPMRVGESVIGAVRFQRRADGMVWDDDDVMLLNALTEQLVQALESARLLQGTQLQAAREQQVSGIASMLANTVDVDTMLRTAVQELGRLPGVREASVHLATVQGAASQEYGGDTGNGNHG